MTDLGGWLAKTSAEKRDASRPVVTLSWAQSLDGSLTEVRGRPTALSGAESTRLTHFLRSRHEAIMVGVLTVIADDPLLTVRHVKGKDPRPVVLDRVLRTPETCRLVTAGRKPIIMAAQREGRHDGLLRAGAEVEIVSPGPGDRGVDLDEVIGVLARRGLKSVMVEGGGEVIAAFLREGLWDRLAITVVPRIIGGYGYAEGEGFSDNIPRGLIDPRWIAAGEDMVFLARREGA